MDHPLATYRKAQGLSQDEAATQLGLSSKSSISNIESGFRDSPLRLGLLIQIWSGGEVQAHQIVSDDDRDLIELFKKAAAFSRVAA